MVCSQENPLHLLYVLPDPGLQWPTRIKWCWEWTLLLERRGIMPAKVLFVALPKPKFDTSSPQTVWTMSCSCSLEEKGVEMLHFASLLGFYQLHSLAACFLLCEHLLGKEVFHFWGKEGVTSEMSADHLTLWSKFFLTSYNCLYSW